MGAYDAAEHQRREEKTSEVGANAADDDDRTQYDGDVEYDVGDADDLLAQFREIKSR
ncbi:MULTISPECIES: DUF5786 family protein [Halococcus]|uniref:DUF5786 domain-containing protein n=2 Tax=Halococcus salifodinae TaxID=36738 RepID=M0NBR5_9EURY|nr:MULTISPECIES: DUF5786 family protein [Halococcus]EMA55311.1 hypothetical protein C450_02875 [Halococcus salifodinae DSM 8989]